MDSTAYFFGNQGYYADRGDSITSTSKGSGDQPPVVTPPPSLKDAPTPPSDPSLSPATIDYTLAQNGDSVLSGGIAVLYLFMNLLSELANQKYLEMQMKAKVSRDAQDKANEVNEIIAKVSKEGDKGAEPLPSDVIQYMKDNGVQIDGKDIDDYLGGDEGKKLDKGSLEAVKDALENVSNRASDFVSQAQLQLQKIMQTYNVSVSLINSMQTMLAEMNKSIAQNIR
ncbi:secretion protein EspA [Parashewanella tropica]|uniref:secretion protein EspA n=1 Tax=Parashewanella tropica TaxID=2547970 RepID=UPI00105A1858|nr:secretion protein EspA [Parashewanella tropica]